jgi:hypothetical protein
MTCFTSHGPDVVADPGNEKARWAVTHRARFVFTYCCPAGLLLPTAKPSVTATPFRCTDGIGILRHRP